MILPEDQILQSQDPIPEDVNDWPEFTLKDAEVRVSGSTKYTSLLEANAHCPLSVTGKLSRLDKQREKLVTYPKYTQVRLKIERCTQHAFGQDPSGKSVLWAAGKTGWFEIIPSTRYMTVYEDICTAIDLIYFLSDTHQTFASSRPIRGAKVQELLARYRQHTDYRIDDDAEAKAIFEKYHSFLIRQMLEGWEGVDWARTHLWKYFSRLYPDEVVQDPTPGCDEADETGDHEATRSNERSTPNSSDTTRADENGNRDWAEVIFDEIMRIKASGHMCKRHCSVDGIAKILVDQHHLASMDEAGEVIKSAAESLLFRLDADPDQGKNRSWRKKVIRRQLQRLVDDMQDSQEEEGKNGVSTPIKIPTNHRHQKSILRPSTGARKGKKQIPDDLDASDRDDEEGAQVHSKVWAASDTPNKKRRLASDPQHQIRPGLTNGDRPEVYSHGQQSMQQQEQLHLIRTESLANGRSNVNHLEALIEGLVQVR